ncbi:hypothetical protein [Cohnella nanjingensis]|uniref:YqzN/YkzM domain-containing protein n=1 Tax=Cohnella nanjingensis TaxID=1387779 RepID=A0A7X0RSR7_9BACL|nr:hypothetical protein [Cohnella nanjingensis]MBB6673017.1 hypothetical protein [Cohnella nanjingensis]
MAKTEPQEQAPAYPRAELLAHSEQLFDVRSEILIGALHGRQQDEYTIDEVRLAVKQFQERKVK